LLQDSVLYREALAETKVAGFRGALQANKEAAKQAAEVAAQQLLAEEEQQQARAAAKKAKKQRQKAKKAQPVNSVAEAVGSLDLVAEQSVDSSEQPSRSAASAPATPALLTDANMLQLFRCPITKVGCVLVICQPVLSCSNLANNMLLCCLPTYEGAALLPGSVARSVYSKQQ
jgi:crotonobetainyl-CoA:carnitine CoA-transferase CaiB-like acyl-CoA transferase